MIIWQSDIEREGMCKEEPTRECNSFCRKFIRRECPGMRYIRTGADLWTDQNRYPFPLYAEIATKPEGGGDE